MTRTIINSKNNTFGHRFFDPALRNRHQIDSQSWTPNNFDFVWIEVNNGEKPFYSGTFGGCEFAVIKEYTPTTYTVTYETVRHVMLPLPINAHNYIEMSGPLDAVMAQLEERFIAFAQNFKLRQQKKLLVPKWIKIDPPSDAFYDLGEWWEKRSGMHTLGRVRPINKDELDQRLPDGTRFARYVIDIFLPFYQHCGKFLRAREPNPDAIEPADRVWQSEQEEIDFKKNSVELLVCRWLLESEFMQRWDASFLPIGHT